MANPGPQKRGGYFHHRRRRQEVRSDQPAPPCPLCQKPVRSSPPPSPTGKAVNLPISIVC